MGTFFKIVGAKYVALTSKEVSMRIDKKAESFNLTGSDLINVHGKRLYLLDIDSQSCLVFEKSKERPLLSAKELDGFLSGGFISGILEALDEKKYDIFSILIGLAIGVFGGLFLGRFF